MVVRVLAYSYTEQRAFVRWGKGCTSNTFKILNGTRQGSVASTVFWSIYLDPLIKELRQKGIGCHVANMFVGVVAYADDLVLLAPNRSAAQNMLATCENFARLHNIKFSTDVNPAKSKSKALFIVGHNGKVQKPVPLILDEKELPYVEKCDHLGHILDVTGSINQDYRVKRAEYIGQTVKLREQFQFAHPAEKIQAIEKNCTHFYGNSLWDLRSEAASMIYSSWRSSVKLAWGLPRNSKNFLIGSHLAPHNLPPTVSLMYRQSTEQS